MSTAQQPLNSLDEWEESLVERYPTAATKLVGTNASKTKEQFRNYEANARPSVREFYRQNHTHQTYDFVQAKRKEFLALNRRQMNVWEALDYLNTLVDDSDPDTDLSQLDHLLQTAEQIRNDGHPRWFILTGLIHDLGKILCLYGEPQWAVVGDTFPVGCAWSDKIVFREFFNDNPDHNRAEYQTRTGIYQENAGLDQVVMSWGHDEYLYHVVKDHLPDEALYMIRYHSFYPAHRDGAYAHLTNEKDRAMLPWVKRFNPYDLYSKATERPSLDKLRPFYQELIAEYFPGELRW